MRREGVVAILTAAGRSRRMGRSKALLDWQGQPLITHQVKALEGLREIIVVLGHEPNSVRPFVPGSPRVRVVENPRYDEGRASSLLRGFQTITGNPTGILVVAVDQPIGPGVVDGLLHGYRPPALIAQPVHAGRRGHPIVFTPELLPELLAITEETEGLRAVINRHRDARMEVPVTSTDIWLDLNSPADYARVTGPLV